MLESREDLSLAAEEARIWISGIEAVKAKIGQRIRVHQQRLRLRNRGERSPQIGRKRRAKLNGFAGDRVREDQPRRMEEMPVLRQLDEEPASWPHVIDPHRPAVRLSDPPHDREPATGELPKHHMGEPSPL